MYYRYVLHDIDIDGTQLLISNREYHPDTGPNAGKHYKASWTLESYFNWTLEQIGMVEADGLTLTAGMVATQPSSIVVANAYPNRYTYEQNGARELDGLFDAEEFSATIVTRVAKSKPDGTPPAWSDFEIIFTGYINERPVRRKNGQEIEIRPAPTQSSAMTPLLDRRFTGMGGHFTWDQKINVASAPTFLGSDWTFQFYGTCYTDGSVPVDTDATIFEVRDSVNTTLFRLYFDISNLRFYIEVSTAAGLQNFFVGSAGSDVLISPATRPDRVMYRIVISWDETNNTITGWFNDVATSIPVPSPATAGQEDNMELFLPRANSRVYASSIRIYNKATAEIGTTTIRSIDSIFGPVDFPDDDLILGYEFNEARGESIADFGSARIDLITNHGNLGYNDDDVWGTAATANLDGAKHLQQKVIPAAFGDCYNVPAMLYDAKAETGLIAAATSVVHRLHVNGVSLVKNVGYTTNLDINSDTQIIRMSATPSAFVDFGRDFIPGQKVSISGLPYTGGEYTIEDVDPSPYQQITLTGAITSPYAIRMLDLDQPTVSLPVATMTSTRPNWRQLPLYNPYTNDGNGNILINYTGNFPENATADIEGDPSIVALNPPLEDYVAPGDFANVVTQMLTRYAVPWTTELDTPDYGTIDGRIGYYIDNAETTAHTVCSQILQGHHTWLIENTFGISSLREYAPPTGAPMHIIQEGSIVSAESPDTEHTIRALNVHYRRNWNGPMTDIPSAADPDTKEFIQNDYVKIRIGAKQQVDVPVPTFVTSDVRKDASFNLGTTALRMAQARKLIVTFRDDDAIGRYTVGDEVYADIPSMDFPAFRCTVANVKNTPAQGTVRLELLGE